MRGQDCVLPATAAARDLERPSAFTRMRGSASDSDAILVSRAGATACSASNRRFPDKQPGRRTHAHPVWAGTAERCP
jgi:hypothetical protein